MSFPMIPPLGNQFIISLKDTSLLVVIGMGELTRTGQEIIADNPQQAEDFKGGKTKLMGYYVGQLMKKTKGKANPQMANQLFSKELNK